jgi:hypothetical protein
MGAFALRYVLNLPLVAISQASTRLAGALLMPSNKARRGQLQLTAHWAIASILLTVGGGTSRLARAIAPK